MPPSQDTLEFDDARRLVSKFVAHYNAVRLHSVIGYVTAPDRLAGRATAIWAERKLKLAAAEVRRRAAQAPAAGSSRA